MDHLCYYCMTETISQGVCTRCGRTPFRASGKERMVLPPGTLLSGGRFMVGAKLGRGGFGITYTGRDNKTGTPIAMKEFFPKHLVTGREGTALLYPPEKPEEVERIVRGFRKEGDILNHLKQHPGIVNVKYRFDDNRTAYIGMELLQGSDLRAQVEAEGPCGIVKAVELLQPVMDALQFIHKNDVLHRDISPDNIFMAQREGGGKQPTLIDFGAAHIAVSEFTQSYPNVKKSGYSPLEQNWVAEKQGPWTDVYSLAATLYYLLTGKVPTPAVERSGKTDPLKPPSRLGVAMGHEAETALLRGMAVRVEDRYPSIQAFRQALEGAVWPERKRKATPKEEEKPAAITGGNGTEAEPKPSAGAWKRPRQREENHGADRANYEQEASPPRNIWVRAVAYLGDLAVFCGSMGLLLGIPGILLGLLLMVVVNTCLTFLPSHGPLCLRLTRWRVQDRATGGPPTLRQSILRSIMMGIVPFAMMEWLWAAATASRDMPHDLYTQTALWPRDIRKASEPIRPAPAASGRPDGGMPRQEKPAAPPTPKAAYPPKGSIRLVCLSGVMAGGKWQSDTLLRIGRNKEQNHVVISPEDGLVSKVHCTVYRQGNAFYLRDEGSKNGTHVNGQKRTAHSAACRLHNQDEVRVGRCVFRVTIQ